MTYSLVNEKYMSNTENRIEIIKNRLIESKYLSDMPNGLKRRLLCSSRAAKIFNYAKAAMEMEGRDYDEVVEACLAKLIK